MSRTGVAMVALVGLYLVGLLMPGTPIPAPTPAPPRKAADGMDALDALKSRVVTLEADLAWTVMKNAEALTALERRVKDLEHDNNWRRREEAEQRTQRHLQQQKAVK